jgi:hypothetical protein
VDGNGGVDEVTRRRRSFISSSAFSVYLGADLTTLSAMCRTSVHSGVGQVQ